MPYFFASDENAPKIILEFPAREAFEGGLSTKLFLALPSGEEVELGMCRDLALSMPMDGIAVVIAELLVHSVRERKPQEAPCLK